jgi:hypothetical protein
VGTWARRTGACAATPDRQYDAPMRRLSCLVGCLALAGAATQASAAAPRALLDAERAEDVAVAGGEVLVAATTSRGGARLTAVPAAGGPPRTVLHARPPGRGAWTSSTRLAASVQLAALLVEFTDPEGNPRDWRVYAGPPAGPLAIMHRVRLRRPGRIWIPIDVDVHGDRLLLHEIRLPRPAFRLTVLAPGVSPEPVPQGRLGAPTALAGDHLAYVGLSGRADARSFIRVVDWRTGRLTTSMKLGRHSGDIEERHLDMAEGSRVVAAIDGRLLAGAPGEPIHRLRGTGRAAELSAPRFAGERIAALAGARLDSQRPVVVDPRAGTVRVLGPPSTALYALAADETTVAWLANGCVLATAVDGGRPLGAPPAGLCPRSEVVLEEGDQVLRGRTLRVLVSCIAAQPTGCRGAVVLGWRGRAGRGRFRVARGMRRTVEVRLSRRGMDAIRRQQRRGDPDPFFRLDARVRDGRVSRGGAATGGVVIDRIR